MLNDNVTRKWLVGAWLAMVSVIIASSVAMDARLSTTALLFLLGIAPLVVMVLLVNSAPGPTMAEILYSVESKDRRR